VKRILKLFTHHILLFIIQKGIQMEYDLKAKHMEEMEALETTGGII
jgi:hypothetical protein